MMIRTLNWNLWTRKEIALVATILVLASGAAYLSVSVARPRPVASAVLNGQWQCTKTAGIVTVCTKKSG
jgi:hypothetical protein